MTKPKYLKRGTLKCPRDQQTLEWETFAGMRVVRTEGSDRLYQAKCPHCGWFWGVHAN